MRTRSRCNCSRRTNACKGRVFLCCRLAVIPIRRRIGPCLLVAVSRPVPRPPKHRNHAQPHFVYVFLRVSLLQVAEAHASVDAVCLGGAVEPPASSCRRSAFSYDCIVRSCNLQLSALFLADGAFCCRYPTADQQRADADAEAVVQHMMDRSLPNSSH